jgi:hypothetical protein
MDVLGLGNLEVVRVELLEPCERTFTSGDPGIIGT